MLDYFCKDVQADRPLGDLLFIAYLIIQFKSAVMPNSFEILEIVILLVNGIALLDEFCEQKMEDGVRGWSLNHHDKLFMINYNMQS